MQVCNIVYWKDNKVQKLESFQDDKEFFKRIGVSLCIDLDYETSETRCGFFSTGSWNHIPIEYFPPEFRATLLIMGIT